MVARELDERYEALLESYRSSVQALIPVLEEIAMASVRDVLPGAHRIEVEGRFNEDWIPTLRILRVVDEGGSTLFDAAIGHDDGRVEETIDLVGVEYLDLLVDLTGDDYMGHRELP
jgi:hypothetical protein